MTPRLDALRNADRAVRRLPLRFAALMAACLAVGWFIGAAVTLIQQGPGVAPW